MSTTWKFNITDDTAHSLVDGTDLSTEIGATNIGATVQSVVVMGNVVKIVFDSTLTQTEAQTLGAAIGIHDGR